MIQGGTVRCWGRNDYGQCNVPSGLKDVIEIRGGFEHTLALKGTPTRVDSVRPISGPSGGGSRVTITGDGFRPDAVVTFDGFPATDVLFVSPNEVQATTPPAFPGEAVVAVDGWSATAFYYRPYCGSDLDQDGEVTAADISIVLLDFGPCYQAPLAAPAPEVPPLLEAQALPDAPRQR